MIAFMEGNVIAVVLVPNNIKIKIEHEKPFFILNIFYFKLCFNPLLNIFRGIRFG